MVRPAEGILRPSIFKIPVIAALLALTPAYAFAATFAVNPIVVSLAKSDSSATIAITNQSKEKLRLEVTGFSWSQRTDGEMQLTPTDNLVFFPQLLTLDPGETKRVRVGVTAHEASLEQSFRVFMEELPSLESVIAPPRNAITIRMKVGVPVFVAPSAAASVAGNVQNASLTAKSLAFDVRNTGNTHFTVQHVRIVAKNASGAAVFEREQPGWYILAGGTRHFTFDVPKGRCSSVRSVQVQVNAGSLNFSQTFPSLTRQCGPHAAP